MKSLALTYKHLNEATWKSLATKHKLKDNGLYQALSDCAKQAESDDHAAVLKALSQATELVGKLRSRTEVAANRDVCAYIDNLAREVGRARTSVAEEKKETAQAEAEEQKSDADEKKLSMAVCAALQAGLNKAKTVECPVLVCVAAPVYGLMVASSISSLHKQQLTQLTESAKFLALGSCIWDEASHMYIFIVQRLDSGLKQKIEQAIKYFTKLSLKVKVMTRVEYEKYKNSYAEPEGESTDAPDETSNGSGQVEESAGDEEQNATADAGSRGEPDEEPLLTGVRPFDIGGSVGQGGKNAEDDVQQVQVALNRKGASLVPDGKIGPRTIQAIKDFQRKIGIAYPDGLVEVGKKTAAALGGSGSGANYAADNGDGKYAGSGKYSGGGTGGSGNYGNGGGGKYAGGGNNSSGKYAGGNGGGSGNYGNGGGGKYAGGGNNSGGKYAGGNSGGSGNYGSGGGGKYAGGGNNSGGKYAGGNGGGSGNYGNGGGGGYAGGGTGGGYGNYGNGGGGSNWGGGEAGNGGAPGGAGGSRGAGSGGIEGRPAKAPGQVSQTEETLQDKASNILGSINEALS